MAISTIPKYRRQKKPNSADLAFVQLSNKRHYLGAYGSSVSKQMYHRLLAEWSADDQRVPVDCNQITVAEVSGLHQKAPTLGGFYTHLD